ncbi:MAG TPA: hypothetical protein VES73_13975 [Lamprocystis sp. (in: g-proteobacteria)]|nr:hypothetical protein [Lamprocystis sp. (in: g-proteobacteria)]
MTDNQTDDAGIIVTLLDRLRTQRLPRTLEIKAKVDAGNKLGDYDIAFLGQMFEDANNNKLLWDRHPELHQIGSGLVQLYREITERALANETGPGPA